MKTKIFMIAIIASHYSYGEEFFNPNFLDPKAGNVADLTIYENSELPAGVYRLDIYINGDYFIEDNVIFKNVKGDEKNKVKPCLNFEMLSQVVKESELSRIKTQQNCIFISDIDSYSTAEYDGKRQRLNISIPSVYMKANARGTVPQSEWNDGINALIMNYRFNGMNVKDQHTNKDSYFLSLTSGVNVEAWRIRNNSTWAYSDGREKNNKWKNISSYAETSIPSIKSNLTLGQLYTQSQLFDNILLKGIQLSSDDDMYPDSLRGFAPTVKGVTSSNAKVEITQNGNLIYSTNVSAGPFEITDLYPTTSSGDLTVKITEQNGKILTYTVPYSTVPNLQREGKSKFSVSLGRSDNANSSYEKNILQASYSVGLSSSYTLNTGVQLAERYRGYALGVAKDLGMIGAISSEIIFSRAELNDGISHDGQSYKLLYAKSLNELGTNIQIVGYRYSTEGYYTLNEAAYKHANDDYDNDSQYRYDLRKRKKGKAQISINQRLNGYGNIYLSGQNENYWNSSRYDRTLQLGINGYLDYLSYNIGLSYNKNSFYEKADKLVSLNLSFPLGMLYSNNSRRDYTEKYNSLYATSTTVADDNGRVYQQSGLSGTLLENNNLSYNLQHAINENKPDNVSVSSTYRGAKAEATVGYNYSNNYKQLNYSVNGSIIAFKDGIVLGQPIYGPAILVSAPGVAGVPIENTTGVQTDKFGYALVPYASSYRKNRVALDLTQLNDDADVNEAVKYVVPTRDAIVRADFETSIGLKAYFTLKDKNGNAIPFGAFVVGENSNTGIVDEDGKVFLSGLAKKGNLSVKWGEKEGQRCTSDYHLDNIETNKLNNLTLLCH